MPSTMSRALRHEDMVHRIVAAARSLLPEHEISIRGVAGKLGLTPPALYRYVPSHRHLLRLVVDAIDDDIDRRIRAAVARAAQGDARERLVAALAAYRSWALSSQSEFALVFLHACDRVGGAGAGQLDSVHTIAQLAEAAAVGGRGGDVAGESDNVCHVLLQVHGVIALEAFGHVDPSLVSGGELFVHSVAQLHQGMGLEDRQRLDEVLRALVVP